jgi:hypothetical protein
MKNAEYSYVGWLVASILRAVSAQNWSCHMADRAGKMASD